MSPSRSPLGSFVPCFTLAGALLLAAPAQATNYSVGTGGGCTHATLQAAVDAAAASPPEADLIRVSTGTYNQQQVTISTGQVLDIIGGYPACNVTTPTAGSRATLDGNGGLAVSVMRVIVPTGGVVRLRNLVIRRGDRAGDGDGGGIYFEGNGRLEVRDTNITNNSAGYGGGLYARGTGDDARVIFAENVTVVGNTARKSGGGVYIDEVRFDLTSPGSGIYLNEALGEGGGGYGGGLIALSTSRDTNVYLGRGMGDLGVVFNNKAKLGGGVALVGDVGDDIASVVMEVYSPVVGEPAGIRDNEATELGGGLFLHGHDSLTSSAVDVTALLWNATLDGNEAPDGAAIYSEGTGTFGTGQVMFNRGPFHRQTPPGGFACPAGQFCGGMRDNIAQDADGTPTDGAVVHMVGGGELRFGGDYAERPRQGGITVEGNRGGRLIFSGDRTYVTFDNALVADNDTTLPLIHVGYEAELDLVDVTLTGNGVASGQAILQFGDGALGIARSIIWEPGRQIVNCDHCSKTLERVIAHERESLDNGSGTQVIVADPRFVDVGFGNYQLTAASPAVDYVPAGGGDDYDALGRPRDVDLPVNPGAFGGIRDIGAFERQSLQPLVLNSDIDTETRLWNPLIAGTISRDTLNASGGTGSGSLRVDHASATPGQPSVAAKQCVHLPGPARYALNGWGRSGTPGGFPPPVLDTTQLRWELRHDGSETCSGGTIAASGQLTLSTGDWRRPSVPAMIDVPLQNWTSRSSIVIYLAVIEASTTHPAVAQGWFDGITLEVMSTDDTMFRNGFE